MHNISSHSFGKDFLWGIGTAAPQVEGAYNVEGRGLSIWDVFARSQGKIKDGSRPSDACNFYYRYKDDLLLAKALGFKVFRFSISWSRILPEGTGKVNQEGLKFYHNLIDECLQLDLVPFITLFHWDLPYALQKEGGWTSHFILRWFARYAKICADEYGDKVKDWMVINEPMSFTALGYMLGMHAPGKKGLKNFFPAVHNATLAQADGARILRTHINNANIGTTFSCSEIIPYTQSQQDIDAANRMDILMNRLFIEPALGLGYPSENFKVIDELYLHNKAWKYSQRMQFDFDFIGIQNYFPLTIKHNSLIPIINAAEVKPVSRKVPHTALGWEINANSFYRILKRYWHYGTVKEIIVSENGAFFKDKIVNGVIDDEERIEYFKNHLQALHKAKLEEPKLAGYFAWTLLDNFEWSEGYTARFGIIHVDYKTQLRTIKNSGYWWRNFLKIQ
ncbi:MAG: GH1 family beta-glucosidase [Chitinophagaceae bacterium]